MKPDAFSYQLLSIQSGDKLYACYVNQLSETHYQKSKDKIQQIISI